MTLQLPIGVPHDLIAEALHLQVSQFRQLSIPTEDTTKLTPDLHQRSGFSELRGVIHWDSFIFRKWRMGPQGWTGSMPMKDMQRE